MDLACASFRGRALHPPASPPAMGSGHTRDDLSACGLEAEENTGPRTERTRDAALPAVSPDAQSPYPGPMLDLPRAPLLTFTWLLLAQICKYWNG